MADQHNDDEGGRVGSSLSLKSTSPHSQVFASTITLSKKYDGPSNRSFKSKSTIGIHAHGSGFVGPLILPSLHGSLDSDDEGGIHRMKIGLLGCCIVLLGCVLGSGEWMYFVTCGANGASRLVYVFMQYVEVMGKFFNTGANKGIIYLHFY